MTATAEKYGAAIAAAIDNLAGALGAYTEGAWLVGQYVQTDDAYTFVPEDRKRAAEATGDEPRGIDMPDAIRLLVGGRVVKVGCPDRAMLQALTQGVQKLDLLAVPVFARGPFVPGGERGKVGYKVRGGGGDDAE